VLYMGIMLSYEKSTHTPSRYHYIVNVPPKLPIVSMSPLNYQKMSMSKKTKITLKRFQ